MPECLGWILFASIVVSGCSLSGGDQPTDAGGMDTATAGPRTAVVGALIADPDCVVRSDTSFLLHGMLDVGGPSGCQPPYSVPFALENFVPAADLPDGFVGISLDAVQVTEATVSLTNVDGSLIETGTLPNPFQVSTYATLPPAHNGHPGTGVVLVDVIPSAYRAVLMALGTARATVVVEVMLTATTVDGERVDALPFRFPIELCVGCLNHCASELTPQEIDTLTAGQCVDNAGADGRVCIDPSC